MSALPGKWSWPELVGLMATQVATTITHERPDVGVEVLPLGSPTFPGYNPERVRVFITNYGVVYQVPVIG
jgi:hypothetical protein